MEIRVRRNERDFLVGKFQDRYGRGCSIQESSLASEAAIWLGVDDPDPTIMASDAAALGLPAHGRSGWIPYAIPPEVLVHTRMHLTQEGAAALIPLLEHFVETGSLPLLPGEVSEGRREPLRRTGFWSALLCWVRRWLGRA